MFTVNRRQRQDLNTQDFIDVCCRSRFNGIFRDLFVKTIIFGIRVHRRFRFLTYLSYIHRGDGHKVSTLFFMTQLLSSHGDGQSFFKNNQLNYNRTSRTFVLFLGYEFLDLEILNFQCKLFFEKLM